MRMKTPIRPTHIVYVLLACGCAMLAACNEDPVEPPSALTIVPLANQLQMVRTGVIESGNSSSQISALSLADSIAKAMAQSGIPAPALATGPQGVPSVLGLLAGNAEVPSVTWAAAPRVPPGVTCVANELTGWWKGDPTAKYGPVSMEATRFELYSIVDGHFGTSPTPIDGFVDVFAHSPRSQGSDAGGVVDILIEGGGGTSTFSFPLSGVSAPGVTDLLSNGGFITRGGSTLLFGFGVTNTTISNQMQVSDLLISTSIARDFSNVAAAQLRVERTGAEAQTIDFNFQFDPESALQTVIDGTVSVDSEVIADFAGGSRFGPVFAFNEVLPAAERIRVTEIFVDATALDSRVADLFTFAHCVGSDDQTHCNTMVTRLLSYGR